jgi:hypothetical protein
MQDHMVEQAVTASPEFVSGVAGHEEHLHRRNLAPNPIRQFAAVYAGQNDVRQQKIDCGSRPMQEQHCLGAAGGFDRAIPVLLQAFRRQLTHRVLVFDDVHGLAPH